MVFFVQLKKMTFVFPINKIPLFSQKMKDDLYPKKWKITKKVWDFKSQEQVEKEQRAISV